MVPGTIFYNDPTGQATYISPNWQDLTGWTPEEAMGKDGWRVVYEEDRAQVISSWRQMVKERKRWKAVYRICRPDGSLVWIRAAARPVFNAQGVLFGFVGVSMEEPAGCNPTLEIVIEEDESERRIKTQRVE
jgi:PAS domain S-box-containing protein